MSQQKFADFLGVSRGYLGDVELNRSHPSRAFLTAITSKTDVSADWVMTGQGLAINKEGKSDRPCAGVSGLALPEALAGDEVRVGVLLDLLSQLDPRERDAILSDAISRATTAQQVADLVQAVHDLTAKRSA
jgi:transcriptional regulator with XRE-family HTH domain